MIPFDLVTMYEISERQFKKADKLYPKTAQKNHRKNNRTISLMDTLKQLSINKEQLKA